MIEDKWLIWQYKHGSSDALGRIYDKYVQKMHTTAMLLVGDSATAEDIVHDVFVKLARSVRSIRIEGSLKAYLTKCVVNRARDLIRGKKPLQTLTKDELLVSDAQGPVQLAEKVETRKMIADALNQLPDEQKEVIVMHLSAGLKHRQIAETLDLSINTVQSRYRYGLEKMRSVFNGELEL